MAAYHNPLIAKGCGRAPHHNSTSHISLPTARARSSTSAVCVSMSPADTAPGMKYELHSMSYTACYQQRILRTCSLATCGSTLSASQRARPMTARLVSPGPTLRLGGVLPRVGSLLHGFLSTRRSQSSMLLSFR